MHALEYCAQMYRQLMELIAHMQCNQGRMHGLEHFHLTHIPPSKAELQDDCFVFSCHICDMITLALLDIRITHTGQRNHYSLEVTL